MKQIVNKEINIVRKIITIKQILQIDMIKQVIIKIDKIKKIITHGKHIQHIAKIKKK